MAEMDWARIRRYSFYTGSNPPEWPVGVRPISTEGLSLLGLDAKGALYWDGEKLQTVTKLGTVERIIGGVVALATVSMAIIDLLRFVGGN